MLSRLCYLINLTFIRTGKLKNYVTHFIAIFAYCSGLEPNPKYLWGLPSYFTSKEKCRYVDRKKARNKL